MSAISQAKDGGSSQQRAGSLKKPGEPKDPDAPKKKVKITSPDSSTSVKLSDSTFEKERDEMMIRRARSEAATAVKSRGRLTEVATKRNMLLSKLT